jgi:hypothetical protein
MQAKISERFSEDKTMESDGSLPRKLGLKLGSSGLDVARMQEVLMALGYLRHLEEGGPDMGDPGKAVSAISEFGLFDEATEVALAVFQESQRILVSRVLDRATLDAMEALPCRAVAIVRSVPPKRTYTYAILNDHRDVSGSDLSRAIEQAFAIWSLHIPLSFIKMSANSPVDISFRFAPLGGELANALIEFNSNIAWRLGRSGLTNSYDLISIAAHEIGHRLGLNHTDVPGSVMFAGFDNSDEHRSLHAVDRANIQGIYGNQPVRDVTLVHGTSIAVETMESVNIVRPMGPLTRIVGVRGLSSSWFHFAILTPLHQAQQPSGLRLHAVRVNIRTFNDSEITRLHIWDGNNFHGQHLLQFGGGVSVATPRQWTLVLGTASKPRLQATGGVGISVDIKWGHGTESTRRVDFISGGADFIEVDWSPPVEVINL